jgi:predicted aspartyl protease
MKNSKNFIAHIVVIWVVVWFGAGCSGQVRPEILEQVRRGAASIEPEEPQFDVPMVGTPVLPLVEVTLNGRGPYRFLFDAGANVVSVKQSVAHEAGLPVLQKLSKRSIVRIDSLAIGGVRFRDVAAVGEPEFDVDGVIGFNLFAFQEGLLTIDYPRQRLSWAPGQLPAPDGVALFEYELRDRMPYIPLQLGTDTLWFNVDTGATWWFYIPAEMEDRLPFTCPTLEGPTVWNQATGWRTLTSRQLATNLRLGPHVVEHPVLVLSPGLDELLVGSGLLQHFSVTFDLAQQRVEMIRDGAGPLRMPE